jgi:adenylate kinase
LPLIEHYKDWAKTGDPSISLKAPQYRRISGLGGLDEIRRACSMR